MFDLIRQKLPEQSTKDFCAANGIGEASYYYWQRKCKQPAGQPPQSFVPVHVNSPSGVVVASIQLPGGAVISVYDVQVLSFMQPYL
jgi:hypothetical protein